MTHPDRNGTIHLDGDTTTITFRRWLPYPVEAVWAAITDPDQLRTWFGEVERHQLQLLRAELGLDPLPANTDDRKTDRCKSVAA